MHKSVVVSKLHVLLLTCMSSFLCLVNFDVDSVLLTTINTMLYN